MSAKPPDTPSESSLARNRAAWNAGRHDIWVASLGDPAQAAAKVRSDPDALLRRFGPALGEVRGRRVVNLQGSHGRIAVALALKGAQVTVIDFAEENRRYALALAEAAGVVIDYRVSDVMAAADLGLEPGFDLVAMELGILHYHHDLDAFFRVCAALARPGGRLLLNEFHPVQRKLFSDLGTGDYFDPAAVVGPVPAPPGQPPSGETCVYRFWTLAEVVSACLAAGWTITSFAEHPDWVEPRRPGTFTLAAGLQGP